MASTLLLLSLATWRISSMLVSERGPFSIFENLRSKVVVWNNKTLIGIFGCIWCMSIYVAALCALVYVSPLRDLLYIPAISAGSVVINALTRKD